MTVSRCDLLKIDGPKLESGGQSSRVTVDTMLSEMADAGYDLTREFIVYALVDFDPAGRSIAAEFVNQLRSLGLKKVREFRPYQIEGVLGRTC